MKRALIITLSAAMLSGAVVAVAADVPAGMRKAFGDAAGLAVCVVGA